MKRLAVLVLSAMLCFPVFLFAAEAVYERSKPDEVVGWSVSGIDNKAGTTYKLISNSNGAYAQLIGEDKVEVLSDKTADITQAVIIEGINSTGIRVKETIPLNTTTGTTAETSAGTYRYIDQASLNATCTGTVTVRKATGDTFILSILPKSTKATIVQHFNGDKDSYITGWGASILSTSGAGIFDLRWYPDDANSLVQTSGYEVLDQIALTNALSSDGGHITQPIKLPAGGWITIHAIANASDSDISVIIQGYDTSN